jgi:hypothetical protein
MNAIDDGGVAMPLNSEKQIFDERIREALLGTAARLERKGLLPPLNRELVYSPGPMMVKVDSIISKARKIARGRPKK